MFASSGAPASCLRSSLPKAGRQSVACASRGLRNQQNRICVPRGSPAARPCRPCWTSHVPSPPCKHDDAFRPLHAGLLAPCTRPASRTRALVDGLCAGVDMPPFTVCSRVTGIPLPWGPLGPVGLAVSAFVIGSTWLDEASTSRDKLNAVTGAVLLCLAAAPRTQGGAAAVSLLLLGSAFLGSAGIGGELIPGGSSSEPATASNERTSTNDGASAAVSVVVSFCVWMLLAAAAWLAAGSPAGLPAVASQ